MKHKNHKVQLIICLILLFFKNIVNSQYFIDIVSADKSICSGSSININFESNFPIGTGYSVEFFKEGIPVSNFPPIFHLPIVIDFTILHTLNYPVPDNLEYGTDYSLILRSGYDYNVTESLENITIGNLTGNFTVNKQDGTQFPNRINIKMGESVQLEGKLFKDNELYSSNLSYEWFKNFQRFSTQNPVLISEIGEYRLDISQAGCSKNSKYIKIEFKISTIKSGNWNDETTWLGGVVPTNLDDVIIAFGHEITMPDNYTGQANNIENNGNLIFGQNAVLNLAGQ
jgi:hypothetical protein